MKFNGSAIVAILLLLMIHSCKKEGDNQRPSIDVITPLDIPVLSVPDSVRIIADVYDEGVIQSVKLVLVNSDRISVSAPLIFYPDATDYRIDEYVRATDKLLPSGEYYILIYATDGTNTKSEYVPLIINEMPREILGYIVVEEAGPFLTRINYLQPELVPDTVLYLQSNHHNSGVSYLYEQFCFITPEPAQLTVYPLKKTDQDWSKQALPPYPEFPSLVIDSELIVGTGNGDIFVYDQVGGVKVKTEPEKDRKIAQIAANHEFIVCEMVSLNGSEHYVYSYYRITGGLNRYRKINGDVTALQPVEKEFLVVIYNGLGSEIFSYEPREGTLTSMNTLQGKKINGSAKISSTNTLLYSSEDIYLYDHQYNTLSLYVQASSDGILFDPLNSVVFIYNVEGVGLYTYPQGQVIGFQSFEGKVRNFEIIYNK
jgi:hypothetical protein